MVVSKLIKHLSTLPQEKEVRVFWDGGEYGTVEGIVDAEGRVVIVGEWSVYRDGGHRAYPERQIVYTDPNWVG